MSVVEKTVEVQCPLSTVYNQWTQFETFPRFMEGVEEVRQMDDTHLHWRADIAGMEREWDAEITEQVPDRKIAWRSTTGPENAGTVWSAVGEFDNECLRPLLLMARGREKFARALIAYDQNRVARLKIGRGALEIEVR